MEKADVVLQMRMMLVTERVETFVKKKLGVSWFKPSTEDQLRLLTLAGWEQKHKISIEWMLQQLVPYWRSRFAKYRKSQGLGVTISTLVGKKSEEFIKQKIVEAFPEGENWDQWRVLAQARQWEEAWEHPIKNEDWENPHEVILQYQRRMVAERRERNIWVRERKKRKYRNNPWRETRS